jgi:hypothetical protein
MKKSSGGAKKETVLWAAKGVSFSPDQLSRKRAVSKERERYIENVSAKALSALTA